ncbi:Rieske 2Fe-2S domain-containing protein [Streptomyces sp. S186]|uniref:Rieske 2Fe-2S domain-containing protein n=1 Tax=Streptomyces sp. S186 TaxID=3434395 RepID=UPI003F66B13B
MCDGHPLWTAARFALLGHVRHRLALGLAVFFLPLFVFVTGTAAPPTALSLALGDTVGPAAAAADRVTRVRSKPARTRLQSPDEEGALLTRGGLVRGTDPHCPHLGAHPGHGGRVEGERLICPFHGFAFDADGSCVATGYGTRPPKAALRFRHSQEANGFVFVWQRNAGLPPQWELPRLSDDTSLDTVETSHRFRGPLPRTCTVSN